eukprot:10774690-Karenia_brevis.AAC.1
MQAAYDTVCARFKCYKGATSIQQTYSDGADYSMGSYVPSSRDDDSSEDVQYADTFKHNDEPSAGSYQ